MSATSKMNSLPLSLPTHLDLPCSGEKLSQRSRWSFRVPSHQDIPEIGVEPFPYRDQNALITNSMRPILASHHPDAQFAIEQNIGIYWKLTDPFEQGAVLPTWFYVPHVALNADGIARRSYVLWQEATRPFLILDFLADDQEDVLDRTPMRSKFWIYEQVVRPSYYGIYQPSVEKLEFYQRSRNRLGLVEPNERKHFPIPELGIEFGIWHGTFQNSKAPWLRAWDSAGNLLLTGNERAKQEAQRAERLAAKLRELGVNPDEV